MKAQINIRRYGAVLVIAATLGIGILIGTFASHGVRAARVAPAAPGAEPVPLYSPVRLSESFAAIAAKVSPEVVNINTESTVRFADKGPDAGPYGQFFNHFFHFGPDGLPHDMRQQSLGSGVILDSHGYVLTNYHVVMQDDGEPVDSIRVFLHDQDEGGRGYLGRIIGKDKWTDLAVIKVDAPKPLPAAQLGDSDAMSVGDWVLAIGSPFGLSATVTAGIISAKGRQIEGGSEGEFKHFLQTDAAINPGNSGGPLVNLGGQVIGINTAIATTHGAYDGVGFAIPSRVVRRIYNSLVATGTVRRGAIGVSFVNDENAALLRSFGADHGVVVQSVEAGGPAESAGIERGDVITTINAEPVHNGDELLSVVSNTGPGSSLRVGIIRDRRPMTRTIIVGDWNKVVGEAEGAAPSSALPSAPESSHGSLGVTVKDLDPADAKELSGQLHLPRQEGVMVVDVTPGGFGDTVGLERFDIILSINHADVQSADDVNRLQARLKRGQDVLLLIARRTGSRFSTLFLADQLP